VALSAIAGFVRARGLVRVPGLAESAAGLVVAALVAIAWFGLGALVLRAIEGRTVSTPRAVATACAFGAGIFSLIFFVFGLVGAYRPGFALLMLVVGLAMAGLAAATRALGMQDAGAVPPTSAAAAARTGGGAAPASCIPSARVAVGIVAIAVVVAGIAALAPPTAKDALQYHLALPKAFASAGRLIVAPENIASYFPLGVEMNGLWAMLVGRVVSPRVGEVAFGATTFAFFPLVLVFVYGWVAERGVGRAWAALAAALVATVPVAYDVAAGGSVDLALALYVAIGTRAVARWWATGDRRELPALALALGFALGVKLLALFPLVLLVLIALLGARRAGRGAIAVSVTIAAALALAAPWYVRTWALTGSPVFPFFLDVWPAYAHGWDTARSVMFRSFNAAFGGDKGGLGFLVLPFRLSLMGQREVPTLYESVLGVAFLAAVPIVVWAAWRRGLADDETITALVGGALFVWWASSGQVMRYLLPVLPLAAVVVVRAAATLATDSATARWLRASLLVPAVAALLVTLAWFVGDAPMLSVLGAEPRTEYLARRLDYFPYYRIINEELPRSARVWLINVRRDTYHLERTYRGDYLFEDHTLRHAIQAGTDADGLRAWARAAGITHVFVRHDALLDYDRSGLVDDRLPESDNVARLMRARDFLLEGTRVLKADRKFLLVALDQKP
jgi:hypothetical protein